jgi:hypothetical protein
MELPTELWHLIGQADSEAYNILARCCKIMSQPTEDIMEHFTTAYPQVTYGSYYKIYKLPNGVTHRGKDQPAIVYEDGTLVYVQMNIVHRDNDLPAIITKRALIDSSGLPCIYQCIQLIQHAKIWFKHGKIHRDNDLPAAINNQVSMWYQNNEKHRDGCLPAMIRANGERYWYIHGSLIRYTIQTSNSLTHS